MVCHHKTNMVLVLTGLLADSRFFGEHHQSLFRHARSAGHVVQEQRHHEGGVAGRYLGNVVLSSVIKENTMMNVSTTTYQQSDIIPVPEQNDVRDSRHSPDTHDQNKRLAGLEQPRDKLVLLPANFFRLSPYICP